MSRVPAARVTAERIASELNALGVPPGGILLVHSSLRSLGPVPGGAETVIRGLLQALGSGGTLLMPALSYEIVTAARPVFDVTRTASNVGAIPEHFRRRAGTRRSVHPTHSVCATGPLAAELLRAHLQDDTPCGPCSPFRLLRERGGHILMLGCGLKPNTSMHGIEEEVAPPYLYGPPLTYTLILEDHSRMQKRYRTHGFRGWRQRYDRVAGVLGAPGLRSGRVLAAEAFLLEAGTLRDAALKALHTDPLFFVERLEPA